MCTFNPAPGKLVLTVNDNGIGIDQQTLPFIFRAFEQGDTREVQPASGLGLGLSISKAIVELHNGIVKNIAPVGMPVGTSVSVTHLFHAVPARKMANPESVGPHFGGAASPPARHPCPRWRSGGR